MGHGTHDPVLQVKYGEASAQLMLSEMKIPKAEEGDSASPPVGLKFKKYHLMQHTVDDEELRDLTNWLKKVIPP